MKRVVFVAIPLLAVVITLLLLVPHHGRPREEGPAAQGPAVTVATFHPVAGATASSLVLPGRVKAEREISLASRLASRLTGLPRREGESFRAGEPLALFESPEARQALESARLAVQAALADLDQARTQAARIDSLARTGVVARRDQELAARDLKMAESTRQAAEATLADWLLNTRLSMPFDGRVVRRHADVGSLLQPGSPILDVRSDAIGEIEVAVPESIIPRLTDTRPEVRIGESTWMPTTIRRVDGMIDHRTRTRTVHLAPPDHATMESGAYVDVRMVAGAAGTGAPRLPAASLVSRGSLTGVYVVIDGRAWLRWLRIGRTDDAGVEVLAGLDPRDEVVVDPRGIKDGVSVTVTR
jgi:RND family efflux transporter MFP subunit